MIKQAWANYQKPTPVKWRKIGDFALIMLPVLQGGLMGAPDLSDATKYYIGFIATVLITGFKFWTNTRKDIKSQLPEPNK